MRSLLHSLPLSWALGLTLFRSRRRSRVSVVTVVSVLGIGVGVATLMAVLAVTGGFEEAFRDRILGVYPHLVVLERGEQFTDFREVEQQLAGIEGVTGTNPSTYDEMMVSSDAGTAGVIVKGVDLDGVDRVSMLTSLARSGTLEPLRFREGEPLGVVIGCDLMERLRVNPGDSISLTTPLRGLEGRATGPFGMAPMEGRFVVRDCFDSGFYEYDSRLVVMDLASAQKFLDRGPAVRWIELRLADLDGTEPMKREVLTTLQPYTIGAFVRDAAAVRRDMLRVAEGAWPAREDFRLVDVARAVRTVQRALEYSDVGGPPQRFRLIDWKEMNRNLFGALKTQKVVLALFFLIIVVVAAFNIVGTQLIVARERVREVSTLVAMGASRLQLARMFIAHGFALGCLGVAVGIGLGLGVVAAIQATGVVLDPKVYLISELPATLHPVDVAFIAGASAVVVLLSCVLSSWRATRLNPVDGLRKVS